MEINCELDDKPRKLSSHSVPSSTASNHMANSAFRNKGQVKNSDMHHLIHEISLEFEKTQRKRSSPIYNDMEKEKNLGDSFHKKGHTTTRRRQKSTPVDIEMSIADDIKALVGDEAFSKI
mmetsp:Transcript_5180/g.5936  ORF Transcript_5180/g.5936 Transcript_5180/m.5936 type:complete len:120 (-) Transcript_5180:121-480(-)